MPGFAPPPGNGLSAQLAEARRRLADLDLPHPVAVRLHKQFIALCNAVKTGSDDAHGQRRLAAFVTALDQAAAKFHGNAKQSETP